MRVVSSTLFSSTHWPFGVDKALTMDLTTKLRSNLQRHIWVQREAPVTSPEDRATRVPP